MSAKRENKIAAKVAKKVVAAEKVRAPRPKKKVAAAGVKAMKRAQTAQFESARGSMSKYGSSGFKPGKAGELPDFIKRQLAHAASLASPWDSELNKAKLNSPSNLLPSFVLNVEEKYLAGTPTSTDISSEAPQSDTGAGIFIARPQGLLMGHVITSGSQNTGFRAANPELPALSPGVVVWNPVGDAETTFILNMNGGLANVDIGGLPTELYPNADPDVGAWISLEEAEEIQSLGAKYAVTSAGAICEYIGPPITGAGELCWGNLQADQLDQVTINPWPLSSTFDWHFPAITYTQLTNTFGFQTGPAIEGCHLPYIPLDSGAFEFQDTVLTYMSVTPFLQGFPPLIRDATMRQAQDPHTLPIKLTNRQIAREKVNKRKVIGRILKQKLGTGNLKPSDVKAFRRRSIDTAKSMSTEDKLRLLQEQLSKANGTKTPAPAAMDDRAVNFSCVPTTDFAGSALDLPFPCETHQTDTAGFAAAAAMSFYTADYVLIGLGGAVYDPAIAHQALDQFIVSYMELQQHPSIPLVVIAWNGVAPSASPDTKGWGGDLFRITWYENLEIVPDRNTLSIGSVIPTPSQTGTSSAAAVELVQSQPNAFAGKGEPPKKGSVMKDLAKGFTSVFDIAQPILGEIPVVGQISKGIADVVKMFAK